MKTITKLFSLMVLLTLLFTSCSSEDDTTSNTNATSGFSWRENSSTAPEKNAASADFKINTLRAYDAQKNMLFEINLMKGSSVGTYTIDGDYVKGTAVYYLGDSFNATSGTLKVTANANGKMSGTFEASGSGKTISKIYGTFNDIPVQ